MFFKKTPVRSSPRKTPRKAAQSSKVDENKNERSEKKKKKKKKPKKKLNLRALAAAGTSNPSSSQGKIEFGIRSPQDVDVLAVLNFENPCSRPESLRLGLFIPIQYVYLPNMRTSTKTRTFDYKKGRNKRKQRGRPREPCSSYLVG